MALTQISTSQTTARHIGALLRDLRKQRHMTGDHVAKLIGISQSRISKIENGYSNSIDTTQIEDLLIVLKAPKLIRQQITTLLFQFSEDVNAKLIFPFKIPPASLESFEELQKNTISFRNYCICGFPTELQIAEYRNALNKRMGFSVSESQNVFRLANQQQESLWNPDKSMRYVVPEVALYTNPGDARINLAQLDRIERIIGTTNVHFGVIPLQAGTTIFEVGSFTIYDDHTVYVIIGDRAIVIKDNDRLIKFSNAFDELCSLASFDEEAISLIRKASDFYRGLA